MLTAQRVAETAAIRFRGITRSRIGKMMMNLKLAWSAKPKKRARPRPEGEPPRKLPLPERKDVFLFGGLAAAGYGVWQIYPPSAMILVGGAFVVFGLLMYMTPKTKEEIELERRIKNGNP